MTRASRAYLVAAVIAAVACDLPTRAADGRFFAVVLNAPENDGAIVLEIRGPAIGSVQSLNANDWLFVEPTNGTVVRAFLTGPLKNGPILSFRVRREPRDPTSAYQATVIEVADRANQLRDAAAYRLTIVEQR
jgi:hypothetical protein